MAKCKYYYSKYNTPEGCPRRANSQGETRCALYYKTNKDCDIITSKRAVKPCPWVKTCSAFENSKKCNNGMTCVLRQDGETIPKRTVKPRTRTMHGWVDDFYLRQHQLGNREEPFYVSSVKYTEIPCTYLTISYQLPAKGKGK